MIILFFRFPHPVTLAGMLEMSTAYMPVNKNWERYIESSHAIFTSMQHELKVTLMGLANTTCQFMHENRCLNVDVILPNLYNNHYSLSFTA